MEYKASTTEAKFPETQTMAAAAATAPVAIGTRGTIGSLVRREFEYFGKLEQLDCRGSTTKARGKMVDMSSRYCNSRKPSFWFLRMTWKWKRQRSSKGFLSSIFSAPEVAETNRRHGIPAFQYRTLKDDMDSLTS